MSNFKCQISNVKLRQRFSHIGHWILDIGTYLTFPKGFTLIETLVVMLILVTVGSIILSIFIIALTGTTKTRNQQIVRENGNYVISQMSRFIQYAKAFNYVDDTYSPNGPGGDEVANCVGSTSDTPYKAVSVSTFDGSETVFACTPVTFDGVLVETISSTSASLSAENGSLLNLGKVRIAEDSDEDSCYFTCTQSSVSESPTIGVHFKLVPKNGSENPILFETSIIPRNF